MKFMIGHKRPNLAIELRRNFPMELPRELSLSLPQGIAEGVTAAVADISLPAVSIPESLKSIEIPSNLPARVAERLSSARAIGLPRFLRRPGLNSLEALLQHRERELVSLRAQAGRSLTIGLAVGVVAGATAVIALLPDRQVRIAELRARLGGLDAPAEYVEDARRMLQRARESIAARVRAATEEARQVEEETKKDLWARFEVAKRNGHVPPQA